MKQDELKKRKKKEGGGRFEPTHWKSVKCSAGTAGFLLELSLNLNRRVVSSDPFTLRLDSCELSSTHEDRMLRNELPQYSDRGSK